MLINFVCKLFAVFFGASQVIPPVEVRPAPVPDSATPEDIKRMFVLARELANELLRLHGQTVVITNDDLSYMYSVIMGRTVVIKHQEDDCTFAGFLFFFFRGSDPCEISLDKVSADRSKVKEMSASIIKEKDTFVLERPSPIRGGLMMGFPVYPRDDDF